MYQIFRENHLMQLTTAQNNGVNKRYGTQRYTAPLFPHGHPNCDMLPSQKISMFRLLARIGIAAFVPILPCIAKLVQIKFYLHQQHMKKKKKSASIPM